MNLFDVTIRREYAPDYKWKSEPEETLHQQFAVDAKECWNRNTIKQRDYWDTVVAVREVPAEELAERRGKLAESRYAHGCCELAVLDNCVCSYCTLCPDHGRRCHGTHD